jgi:Radical SAM superfamily/4Fe-4S single cluster domain
MDDGKAIDPIPLSRRPAGWRKLDVRKFHDPAMTAKGERRAGVAFDGLRVLWVNTGTLCNIACANCYIASSPRNDRLTYLGLDELRPFLDEIARDKLGTREIGFTGGEPFMNPAIIALVAECLTRGFRVLVLTNAMRPMQRLQAKLAALNRRYGARLTIRVSLDHYTAERHEAERGAGSWAPTVAGLCWLAANRFDVAIAGRAGWGENEAALRAGYDDLVRKLGLTFDAADPERLVLFPEIDDTVDVPEITEQCWDILHVAPSAMMCASSRMVVKRKGASGPTVVACTLLPYTPEFELGATLAESRRTVPLNHPNCAKFCVLGGASCSRG